MSSSCIEEVSVPDDDWYRIVSELLAVQASLLMARIRYSGKNPDFLNAFCRKGR
jgi:cyclopropane-fatty-acyl-phospholipid synthase